MDKSLKSKKIYEFGEFSLNANERQLLRLGQPVQIPPKAFDTLLALVENSGHLITKDELMKTVWPDAIVEESNLALNIHTLRKIFSEGSEGEQTYIETVPKKGYRFKIKVREVALSSGQFVLEKHTITHIVKQEGEEIGRGDVINKSFSYLSIPASCARPRVFRASFLIVL